MRNRVDSRIGYRPPVLVDETSVELDTRFDDDLDLVPTAIPFDLAIRDPTGRAFIGASGP